MANIFKAKIFCNVNKSIESFIYEHRKHNYRSRTVNTQLLGDFMNNFSYYLLLANSITILLRLLH